MATTHPMTPQAIRFTEMEATSPIRPPISPLTPRTYRNPAARDDNDIGSPSPTSRKRKHDSRNSLPLTLRPAPTPRAPTSTDAPTAEQPKVQATDSEPVGYPARQSPAGYLLRLFHSESAKKPEDLLSGYWRRDGAFSDFCTQGLQAACRQLVDPAKSQEQKDMLAWAWERSMETAGGMREALEGYFVAGQKGLKFAEGIGEVVKAQKARKEKAWDEQGRVMREGREMVERRKTWEVEWEERHEANDPECQYEVEGTRVSEEEHERAKKAAMRRWTDEKEWIFQQQLKAKKTRKEKDAEDAAAREARYYAGEATQEDEVLYTAESTGLKRQCKAPKRYSC